MSEGYYPNATRNTDDRAVIIGGSMGGLFAALPLRKFGWQLGVFERAGEALANRGAGIATHHERYDAVRAADPYRLDLNHGALPQR